MKTPIKYDLRSQKTFKNCTIITFVLLVVGLILGLIIDQLDIVWIWLIGLSICFMFIGGPLFLLSMYFYLSSTIYLRRLKHNGFEVPEDKRAYGELLEKLPREGDAVSNRYAGDSRIIGLISLIIYIACVAGDVIYLIRWLRIGEDEALALFIILMLGHLLFVVLALIYYRQRNTERYIDNVDIKDGRKVRANLVSTVTGLIILAVAAGFSINMAESMTRYVYRSKYGRYEKTMEQFKEGATIEVTSSDLNNGVWDDVITDTDEGENLSPEIIFDEVEGAAYYVILMEDESANYWVHWYASGVTSTELETGANVGDYIGPYPPVGSGEHVYTVFVYALADEPATEFEPKFDEPWLAGDLLYYDYLNVSGHSGNLPLYGNVIEYGYLTGTYSR